MVGGDFNGHPGCACLVGCAVGIDGGIGGGGGHVGIAVIGLVDEADGAVGLLLDAPELVVARFVERGGNDLARSGIEGGIVVGEVGILDAVVVGRIETVEDGGAGHGQVFVVEVEVVHVGGLIDDTIEGLAGGGDNLGSEEGQGGFGGCAYLARHGGEDDPVALVAEGGEPLAVVRHLLDAPGAGIAERGFVGGIHLARAVGVEALHAARGGGGVACNGRDVDATGDVGVRATGNGGAVDANGRAVVAERDGGAVGGHGNLLARQTADENVAARAVGLELPEFFGLGLRRIVEAHTAIGGHVHC